VSKRVAVAFTGPSNSGKTTLVEKIAKILIKQRKVAIIKNDPKDKAQFDVEGKDSHKFSQTGAEVVIVAMINDFDILLVEGLKTLPLPRIAVFRNKIDESYFDCSEAIAIDDTIDITTYTIPEGIDILDLNNSTQIIEWINAHAKRI